MDVVKRASIANLTRRRSGSADRKGKDSPKRVSRQTPAVQFDIVAESPPALLLGPPDQSSGALYACKLKLKIAGQGPQTLTALNVTLSVISSTLRPVDHKCLDCAEHGEVLKEWSLLSQPKAFAVDEHSFPLSYLIPGTAPVTVKGNVARLEYRFRATAKLVDSKEVFQFTKPLFVNRALRRGNDKNSKRIFPPTTLNMDATQPSVIFPLGTFDWYIRISGVTVKQSDRQLRWRLSRLSWRITETENTISPACSRHVAKVGGTGKGIAHEYTRTLASQELRSGWKTDFADDQIECDISCALDASSRANTSMQTTSGPRLKISHALQLELVIAEELALDSRPDRATPTGNARVLRTHFPLVITARSGMGVAWDDEQPPLYEDVPASPPVYHGVETMAGYVERLQLP